MRSRSLDVGIFRRALDKLIVGPIKYRSPRGYDAQRDWGRPAQQLRHVPAGSWPRGSVRGGQRTDVRGSGQNVRQSRPAHHRQQPPATLEIGCGVGFYTGRLQALGVTDYTGLDITDALFSSLRDRFPNYSFVRGDITSYTASEKYGLLVMIDVTEHIVTGEWPPVRNRPPQRRNDARRYRGDRPPIRKGDAASLLRSFLVSRRNRIPVRRLAPVVS